MTVFHIRLRAYRLQKGIPVRVLAKNAGMTRAYLYEIEKGKCPHISLDMALSLAEALGVSIYDLLPQQIGVAANSCPNCTGYETAFRSLEARMRDLKTKLTLLAKEV